MIIMPRIIMTLCALMMSVLSSVVAGAGTAGANVLPRPPEPFSGKLGSTEKESSGSLPTLFSAPEGAPNILLVMTDYVGSRLSAPLVARCRPPNLDRLAERGLRYNQFHTTAICSPARAALLTGRNHHAVGLGTLVDVPSPYPGYTASIPPSAATVA